MIDSKMGKKGAGELSIAQCRTESNKGVIKIVV